MKSTNVTSLLRRRTPPSPFALSLLPFHSIQAILTIQQSLYIDADLLDENQAQYLHGEYQPPSVLRQLGLNCRHTESKLYH